MTSTNLTEGMFDTSELRRLAEAATQGEWRQQQESGPYPNWHLVYSSNIEPPLLCQVLRGDSFADMCSKTPYYDDKSLRSVMAEANAKFIAAANPQTVLALLDRIQSLEAMLHEVREVYAGMDGFIPQTAPEGYLQRIVKQMYEAATPPPPQEKPE